MTSVILFQISCLPCLIAFTTHPGAYIHVHACISRSGLQSLQCKVLICVDYHRLNAVTKIEVFLLSRIDDLLDMLLKSKFFTTLDLESDFWQVKMEPSSREKTAYVTHLGLYEFSVIGFGLVNAPLTFQQLMESVLVGLSGEKINVLCSYISASKYTDFFFFFF